MEVHEDGLGPSTEHPLVAASKQHVEPAKGKIQPGVGELVISFLPMPESKRDGLQQKQEHVLATVSMLQLDQ